MVRRFAAAVTVVVLAYSASAQERDRAKIPDRYKWDLTHIYPSNAAWRAAKEKVHASIPELGRFKGRLGSSAAALADALELATQVRKEIYRLSAYANMQADQDTRVSESESMRQEVVQMFAAYGAEISYIQPEILQIDRARLQQFLASEPRLAGHRFFIDDLIRRAAHTLSDEEEKILASAGPVGAAPGTTFNLFLNADFPYPTVALSDGRAVKVDQAAYTALRALPDRADREKVMSAYFQAFGTFSRTIGSTMSGSIQRDQFLAKMRKYPSDLEARLDGPNIPVSVYTRLVEGVNRHLPTFHRYLKLRKRLLGVDELHYYDLYAPLVASVKLEYSPEEAYDLVLAALRPLGSDYTSLARRVFTERWTDLYPSEGKRSGAYASGAAYDVHPYMLLNYNGKYDDVSTIAHELGHVMHSYYSNKTQPFQLAGYPTFVAEVASTFNEALLIGHMLEKIKDRDTRLALLGNYLEGIKGTVVRQTQFAEFELRMHELAQQGKPLTGEGLAKLYLEITRKYYGHDQKICVVDDYIAHEWSQIPHFYSSYYVFQYATSFTAAAALSEKAMASGPDGAAAIKRYLTFLSSGGSKYPIDLLRDAGVDMTTNEPLELTMIKMNRVMDEIEKLLAN